MHPESTRIPDLSIVTVTFHSEGYIQDCLESVRDGSGDLDIEYILVDNASNDRSVEIIKREFPEAKLIENEANRGFTAANNQGAEHATGRYVMFLNPDTVIPEGTFQKLIEIMDQQPDIGVLAPRLVDEEGKLAYDMGNRAPSLVTLINTFWLLDRLSPDHFPGVQRSKDIVGLEDCDWACGACIIVRGELVKEFSWTHFGVGDDFAYCIQIKEAGWRIAVTGDAEILHYAGRSWKLAPTTTLKGPPSNYARYLVERKSRVHAILAIAAMRGGLRLRSSVHRLLYYFSKDSERLYKANKTLQFLGHDEYAVFKTDHEKIDVPDSFPS